LDTVAELVYMGADSGCLDNDGNMPIHLAAMNGLYTIYIYIIILRRTCIFTVSN
jgi:ankyrin repeat protein